MSRRDAFEEANKILASAVTDEYKDYFDYDQNIILIKNNIKQQFKDEDTHYDDRFFQCALNYIACIPMNPDIRLFTFFVDNNKCYCKYIDYSVNDITIKDVQQCMDNFIEFLPVLCKAYTEYKKLKVIKQMEDI